MSRTSSGGMKAFAVGAVLAVTVVLAGGAPAGAVGAGGASVSARKDCDQSRYLCLWDGKNYQRNVSWYEVTAAPRYKCGKGSWKPPYAPRRLPRSTWNRTTKTWYGKDSRNKDRQIIRKTGMRGSTDPDISAWKSIKKWCWK